MEKIYECHCGCGTIIWKDGDNELTFESLTAEREVITHIDRMGFVNGKYSLPSEGFHIVALELQFMRNIVGVPHR